MTMSMVYAIVCAVLFPMAAAALQRGKERGALVLALCGIMYALLYIGASIREVISP